MKNYKNQYVITGDGSSTLFNATIGEHYHSTFGAIQESRHIFIEAGLVPFLGQKDIQVFEVGFGTGLNALLTMKVGAEHRIPINYTAIELFPISLTAASSLNYPEILQMEREAFLKLHQSDEVKTDISPMFFLDKTVVSFPDMAIDKERFHVVYFDAFSPEAQPEMWTEAGFKKLFEALKTGGVLVTYSCKGMVKRAMKSAGFRIEKLPGPPGKREFLRAWKG